MKRALTLRLMHESAPHSLSPRHSHPPAPHPLSFRRTHGRRVGVRLRPRVCTADPRQRVHAGGAEGDKEGGEGAVGPAMKRVTGADQKSLTPVHQRRAPAPARCHTDRHQSGWRSAWVQVAGQAVPSCCWERAVRCASH
eukprot:983600-Rhodomonas_salina.1